MDCTIQRGLTRWQEERPDPYALQFIVEGKLYGAVAASVKIGTELHVGNLSPNGNLGNFGVAGRIPQVGEYDTVRTSTSGGVAGGGRPAQKLKAKLSQG